MKYAEPKKRKATGLFCRILLLVMGSVLLCVAILFSAFYMTMRSNYVQTRLEELKAQAYDIAYLASRVRGYSLSFPAYGTVTEQYISWKVNRVYQDYHALTVVVDRTGKATLYAAPDVMSGEDGAPDSFDVLNTLKTVLGGEESVTLEETDAGPVFTVAVPWVDSGIVYGAVYVRTAAQPIYAEYQDMALKAAAVTLALLLAAAAAALYVTRQLTRPLKQMAQAAEQMAGGHFDIRVPAAGSRETRDLAAAFNAMAEKLQHLEQERRDFLANVSHELRSPMTSIQGYLEGILDGTVPAEKQRETMGIVLDETRRLTRLVGNLLNLSRLENPENALVWSDFDIHELIRRVIIASITQLDDKKMDVDLRLNDAPLMVHADQDQIEQVLINLVSNAAKYAPEGGRLAISTRAQQGRVTVQVEDDGQGILPEDAPHIFDRFYKADKAHTVGKGTGLGLAICKSIMERHGQSIRLVPSAQGCVFEFTLAAAAPAERN